MDMPGSRAAQPGRAESGRGLLTLDGADFGDSTWAPPITFAPGPPRTQRVRRKDAPCQR